MIMNVGYNGTIAPGQSVSFGVLGQTRPRRPGPDHPGAQWRAPPLVSSDDAGRSPPATFTVTGQSNARYPATVTITNMGTVPIGGWALQFKFSPKITLMNNAAIVDEGVLYVIRDAGYDGVIDPGKSVQFPAPRHAVHVPVRIGALLV